MSTARSNGLRLAIKASGSLRNLATALGINHSAVAKWADVPAHRIIEIEKLTGVPREKLRPELYR